MTSCALLCLICVHNPIALLQGGNVEYYLTAAFSKCKECASVHKNELVLFHVLYVTIFFTVVLPGKRAH